MSSRVISIILRGDIAGLRASMTAAQASVRGVAGQMTAATAEGERFRGGLTAVGNTAGKMGLVAAAGMGAAIKAAVDWQTAWAGVTKTVDGSASQLDALEGGLRGLAKELPSSHKEIAAVAEAAGQLGVAREDVVDFTEVMLKLAMSTDLDADTAATSISQLMNVMGTAPDQVDEFAATLVALGNDGASTESQIVQMAQRIAGAAATVGLSEGEVLAFANTVASMGIEVEAGGTAVSTVIATMSRATQSGGEKLDSFASTAGMSAEAFAKSFKEKPAEAMVAFIDGLARTQEAGGNLYAQLDAVGLSDIRVSQALIGMASSGDLLTDSLKLQGEAWAANNALNEEVDKRLETSAAKSQIAMNGIRDAAINLGEAGLPALSALADAVSVISDFFGGLPAPVQTGTLALGGFTAAVGLSAFAASRAVGAYTNATGALTNMGMSASAARGAMMRVGAAGIGVGLAAASASIDDSNKSLKALTSTASGAAMGFAVGGPWGAAIGGGIGLLQGLMGGSDGAAVSMEGLTATLDDQTGAITENTTSWVTKTLAESNSMDALKHMGVDMATVTDAVLGNKDAMKEVAAAADEYGMASGKVLEPITAMREEILRGKEAHAAATAAEEGSTEAQKALREAAASTAEEVKSLSDALDGLLDPLLTQDQATVAWRRSIGSLTEELAKNKGNLDINTKAGQDNRDAIRGRIEDLKASVSADSEAGVAQDVLGAKMLRGAENIIKAGTAAGISEKEMRGYIEQLGLTPEAIDTLITAKDEATPKVKEAKGGLADLDGTKVMTAIGVQNAAIAAASMTRAALKNLDGDKADVTLNAKGGALAAIRTIQAHMATLRMTAAVNLIVNTIHRTKEEKAAGGHVGVLRRAPGGSVIGAGTGTSDDIPAMLSNGEHVLTAEEVKRAGGQGAVYRLRAAIMAGLVPAFASGGAVEPPSKLDIAQQEKTVRDIERSLAEREKFGKKPRKGKDNRPTRNVLRGLDRDIARLELADAKQDLRDLKSGKEMRLDRKEKARELREKDEQKAEDAAEQAAKDAEDAAKTVAEGFANAKTSATSKFGIGSGISAASVDRNLSRLLVDSQTFLGLLGDLKAKGASPWLLAQLVEAGPTKSAIKLAREYNTNQAALDSINGRAAQIDSYGNSYSSLVGDSRFMQAGAWNSGVNSSNTTQVQITTTDISQLSSEIARQVDHRLSGMATGAGV